MLCFTFIRNFILFKFEVIYCILSSDYLAKLFKLNFFGSISKGSLFYLEKDFFSKLQCWPTVHFSYFYNIRRTERCYHCFSTHRHSAMHVESLYLHCNLFWVKNRNTTNRFIRKTVVWKLLLFLRLYKASYIINMHSADKGVGL